MSFDDLMRFAQKGQIKRAWKRWLPTFECDQDRWERAKQYGFSEGTSIYEGSYVYDDVTVGRDCWIGPLVILDGTGGLTIGDHCSISAGVHVYSHDTVGWAVSDRAFGEEYAHRPVTIGSNCFIGANAVILPGVTLEPRTIIPAGFVVRSSTGFDRMPRELDGGLVENVWMPRKEVQNDKA